NHQISIYLSERKDCFSACVQDRMGSQVNIDSTNIKCGIGGTISHVAFIRKVDQLAREKLAVFAYQVEGQPTEVWIFEATKTVAPLIKKAKENQRQGRPEDALKQFETALKIQEQQHGETAELNSTISQLKKELFLFRITKDTP